MCKALSTNISVLYFNRVVHIWYTYTYDPFFRAATTFLLLLLGMLLGLEEAINYDIFIVQHGLLSGEYICVNKHLESPFGI